MAYIAIVSAKTSSGRREAGFMNISSCIKASLRTARHLNKVGAPEVGAPDDKERLTSTLRFDAHSEIFST